ncbi:ester cyclase [Nonomuraea sp. NPDC050536]|uniref:ester cyclase n=1 Tax=Nonomuraea sp. NPDC050536 TaxID=3364366 RepID=UPI0037C78E20
MLPIVSGATHRLSARVVHHDLATSHEEITPMTTREDASALVLRLQECFNTRQFDQADDLFTPGFFSHPLGTTGFEAGKDSWRKIVARFPDIHVVADDILVDGDKVAIRSSIVGIAAPDSDAQPMLLEIFRIDDGRLAEMWGITEGPRVSELSDSPRTS